MNVFAKIGEIPSRTLQDIKETKRFGHTFVRSDGRTDGRTDNVKTVYPPTNIVCGGYNEMVWTCRAQHRLDFRSTQAECGCTEKIWQAKEIMG